MTQSHDDKYLDRLSEFIDGDMAPDEREALELHARSCSACRTALDELNNVVRVLRTEANVSVVAPVHAMWTGIASQLTVQERNAETSDSRQSPWPLRVLIAALIFLLGVAAGIWYERGRLSGSFDWHIPKFMRAIETPMVDPSRVASAQTRSVNHSPTETTNDD